jgi:hypothetical protein
MDKRVSQAGKVGRRIKGKMLQNIWIKNKVQEEGSGNAEYKERKEEKEKVQLLIVA